LSGPFVTADLHLGSSDLSGGVLFSLCRLCKAGQSGSTKLTPRGLRLIRSGRVYVVVRTAKNPHGEMRGRLITAAAR
jgi:hypothetical protein